MVKSLCGELVNDVLYDCQQFHGGFGYMREAAIERMVRDARVQAIGGGATEVMLEEVAKKAMTPPLLLPPSQVPLPTTQRLPTPSQVCRCARSCLAF